MSTTETVPPRYERVISSVRSDAKKITEAINRMEEDAGKLIEAGHPAQAARVGDTVTAMRIAVEYLREVFRLEI